MAIGKRCAKPVWLPILEPSMKQGIAPRKVDKIRKWKWYTVAFVELLGKLQSLSTMVGGGIAHGSKKGNMGGRQWKRKFLNEECLRKYRMWVNDLR